MHNAPMRFKNKPSQPSHPSCKISAVSAIAFVMSLSGLSLALTSLPAGAQETKVQENKAPASKPVTETSADLLSLFREAAQNDPVILHHLLFCKGKDKCTPMCLYLCHLLGCSLKI